MNNAPSDFRLHSSLTEPLAPLISRHSLPQYPSLQGKEILITMDVSLSIFHPSHFLWWSIPGIQVFRPSLAGNSLCCRLFPPRGPRNFLRDIPLANRTSIRSSANPRRPQRAQSQARSARRRRALNPRVESFSSLARALIIAILATSNLTRYWTRGKSIRSGSKFQDRWRSDRGVPFLLPSSTLAISFSLSPSRGRGCRSEGECNCFHSRRMFFTTIARTSWFQKSMLNRSCPGWLPCIVQPSKLFNKLCLLIGRHETRRLGAYSLIEWCRLIRLRHVQSPIYPRNRIIARYFLHYYSPQTLTRPPQSASLQSAVVTVRQRYISRIKSRGLFPLWYFRSWILLLIVETCPLLLLRNIDCTMFNIMMRKNDYMNITVVKNESKAAHQPSSACQR